MRDIKFRAWSTTKETWCDYVDYAGSIANTLGTESAFVGYLDDHVQTNVEVQQFTGILDENGKEVYQGDILKVKNEWNEESLHVVAWYGHRDYPAFDLEPSISEELNSLSQVIMGDYDYHIIGNIYENKDLIK